MTRHSNEPVATAMKRAWFLGSVVCALASQFGLSPASAQVPAAAPMHTSERVRTLVQLPAVDSTEALFRRSDLAYAAVFFGSLIAIKPLAGVDESLSPDNLPTGFASDVYEVGDAFGNGLFVYSLAGAALLGGQLFDSSLLSRVGVRALGSLAASTVIVFPTKVIVGRRRPSGGDRDADEFDSFAFSSRFYSFPSGHTASAFALAGAVSDEFAEDASWVPYVAYPVALFTGTSRVLGRKHWVTDVIAGAAAGMFANKLAGRILGGSETERGSGTEHGAGSTLQPIFSVGGGGWIVGLSARTR